MNTESIRKAISLLRENGSLREGDLVYTSLEGDLSNWHETEWLDDSLWGAKDKDGNWLCFGDESVSMDILP